MAGPRHKRRAQAAPPGVARGPAVPPTLARRLDLRIGIVAEALGKSPAGGSLHRSGGRGLRS